MSNHLSVLIIGASGRTGAEIMKQLAVHPSKPRVHAFCRNPDKLPKKENGRPLVYHGCIKGDARNADDVQRALEESGATFVILSTGNGDDVSKTDVREATGLALAKILEQPKFQHVSPIIISSIGAGESKIDVGFGVGKVISFKLRHVLKDHTMQEAAFKSLKNRTLILRATALTDNKGNGKYAFFDGVERPKSMSIDRSDVAGYVVGKMMTKGNGFGGRIVHITGEK